MSDDLARIAYDVQAAHSLRAGLLTPSWARLSPEQMEMYDAMGQAVAKAERERIRQLAIRLNATYLKWDANCDTREQWTFADLLEDPR